MKVGDLVQYDHPKWDNWYGIIIRQIPGTDERCIVRWSRIPETITSNPKKNLKLINSS